MNKLITYYSYIFHPLFVIIIFLNLIGYIFVLYLLMKMMGKYSNLYLVEYDQNFNLLKILNLYLFIFLYNLNYVYILNIVVMLLDIFGIR